MKLRPTHLIAPCLVIVVAACGSSTYSTGDDEWRERRTTEQRKAADHADIHCIEASSEVDYLLLFYCPWDRVEYQPVLMAPLRPDFLRTFVEESAAFADDDLRAGLTGQANQTLNQQAPGIADGRVNAVYVALADGLHLGVAPFDASSVLVWLPGDPDQLSDEEVAAGKTPPERVWQVDLAGRPLEELGNRSTGSISQPASYHRTYYWPSRSNEFWTGPGQTTGFWTYAAWPPRLGRAQLEPCKPLTGDILRH